MTRRRLGLDQRGGVLALVAVTMVALLGMAALAVDLARGFAARAEAQRVADSSALAGASAYMTLGLAEATQVSEERAYEYALLNLIQGEPVDSSQVEVVTIPAEQKVRVRIEKTDLPTWFGRVLGFDFVPVAATAAAEVREAGAAKCLKPFAVPDLWDETDPEQDLNQNMTWEEDEPWVFEPPDDEYGAYTPKIENDLETGYGSDLRGPDRDFGRLITIKVSDPQSNQALSPGLFYPWRLPIDPDQEPCDKGGGGGGSTGGAVYRQNICECNASHIELGLPYDLEPGNMIGPTNQGVGELYDEDPDADWILDTDPDDPTRFGYIEPSADYPDPMDSPRVMKIALFDMSQIDKPGMQSIVFNNFALMFLMNKPNGQEPVIARFMYWAEGSGPGPTTGSLVKYLRLVE